MVCYVYEGVQIIHMKTIHIVDIDTTIADNVHRAKLLKRTCLVCLAPKGAGHRAPCPACGKVTESRTDQAAWDSFFSPELVIKDTVQPNSLEYFNKLRGMGATIHFLTGRSEPAREVTNLWLQTKFNLQKGEELIMRPVVEDGLLASQYKERALHRLSVAQGFTSSDTFFFYEDDPHVMAMYSRHGVVIRCPEAWEYLMPDFPEEMEKAWSKL